MLTAVVFSLSSLIVGNNHWSWLIALAFVNSAVLLALYRYCSSTHGLWKTLGVPHIRPVPVFGSFFRVAFGLEHQVDLYRRVYNQLAGHRYGGFHQMNTPYLMIRDPELIKTVLVKDFLNFPDRGVDTEFSINPLSRHLFFMGYREWKVMRNKLSPTFTSGKLKLMYNQIRDCSNKFINSLHEALRETDEIDFRYAFAKYSIDVIGTCFFGLKMNTISDESSAFHKHGMTIFKPSFRMLIRELCVMINPALLKLFKIRDFKPDAVRFFQSIFRNTIKYREQNNIVKNDFIHILMQVRRDLVLNETLPPSEKFTETHIESNAFVMFAAGFETLATTISFCLYELSMKKHIQDKARAEILSLKSKNGGIITNDMLFELYYIDMILEETLRKYPLTHALFRQASQSYRIPNDSLTIPKGQKIIIPTHSVHYNPKYYPDPEVFDPKRFTPEEKIKRPGGTYFPFGEGPRMCIAKRFANVTLKLALMEILSYYEVEPCERTVIPIVFGKGSFIIVPGNKIWLRLKLIAADDDAPHSDYL